MKTMNYNEEVYIQGGYYLEFEDNNGNRYYFSYEEETETHECDGDRWTTTKVYLTELFGWCKADEDICVDRKDAENEEFLMEICQTLI